MPELSILSRNMPYDDGLFERAIVLIVQLKSLISITTQLNIPLSPNSPKLALLCWLGAYLLKTSSFSLSSSYIFYDSHPFTCFRLRYSMSESFTFLFQQSGPPAFFPSVCSPPGIWLSYPLTAGAGSPAIAYADAPPILLT